ncbi:MAG: hypothetical protein ACKOPQ_05570 [Novosphingobium sp.]
MSNTRRTFLGLAAMAPAVAISLSRQAAAQANTCLDPAGLPASQKSLRASLEFVELSKDPKMRCGLCAFYQAKGDCGTCQILTSTVSPASYCSSFAARSQ